MYIYCIYVSVYTHINALVCVCEHTHKPIVQLFASIVLTCFMPFYGWAPLFFFFFVSSANTIGRAAV